MTNFVSTIIVLWTLSGLFGLCFRVYLLTVYYVDLKAVKQIRHRAYLAVVVYRHIQSAWLHIIVKAMITAIGLNALVMFLRHPVTDMVSIVPTIGLLIIPWALTIDGFYEIQYLHKLMRRRNVKEN